ncbi:MAG: VanZ family protein [Actinomycetes bacterium]
MLVLGVRTQAVRGWRVLLAAAVAVQLVVLYAPDAGGGSIMPGQDKVVHALVFALVVWTGLRAGVPAVPLVALSLLHAPVSEIVQARVFDGRTGDVADAAADVAGVLAALAVVGLARRRRRGIMGS